VLLKQSTGRNLSVFMTSSTDHITGKTGLTLTITASKDGAAFGSISPTVTELANGWYSVALTSSHTDTLGDLALHITGTAADHTDLVRQVVLDLPGSGASAADIAYAVWDEAIATHQNAGSTGEALTDAGAGGNPWNAVLDGVFTAGDLVRMIAAVNAGKLSSTRSGNSVTFTYRDVSDASDIVAGVATPTGRQSVTLNP
jgi:hypothetical protein